MTGATRRFSVKRVIVATLTILLLVGGIWVWRGLVTSWRRAMQLGCAVNMKQVMLLCLNYRETHHGAWPDRFADLVIPAGHDPEKWARVFTCPAEGMQTGQWEAVDTWADYRLVTEVKPGNPANVVLVYESPANHHHEGVNVGFADGHIEWVPMTHLPPPLAHAARNRSSEPRPGIRLTTAGFRLR